MKIDNKLREENDYGDLDFGDCFQYSNRFWIKTNIFSEHDCYYGINLETGEKHLFSDSVTVRNIDARVVIQ